MTLKFWNTAWFWRRRNNLANRIEAVAYIVRYRHQTRKAMGSAEKEYNQYWS